MNWYLEATRLGGQQQPRSRAKHTGLGTRLPRVKGGQMGIGWESGGMLGEQAMHWGLGTGSGGTWRVSWGHLQNPGQDLSSWPDSTHFSSLTSPGPCSQAHLRVISVDDPLLFGGPLCLSFPPSFLCPTPPFPAWPTCMHPPNGACAAFSHRSK